MRLNRRDVNLEIASARAAGRTPNFQGSDLESLHLMECDLSGANLAGANLRDTQLYKANLTGANLTGADLTGAYLTRASFHTEQLLDTYGLNPTFDPQYSMTAGVWDDLLPKDPTTRELTIALLQDWDGTLREAITTAEELRKS